MRDFSGLVVLCRMGLSSKLAIAWAAACKFRNNDEFNYQPIPLQCTALGNWLQPPTGGNSIEDSKASYLGLGMAVSLVNQLNWCCPSIETSLLAPCSIGRGQFAY